jgi:hypothetical protein
MNKMKLGPSGIQLIGHPNGQSKTQAGQGSMEILVSDLKGQTSTHGKRIESAGNAIL